VRFASPLTFGRLQRRYQRFFVDVELADGSVVTAHCPNTGALTGCLAPGSAVGLAPATTPGRKLAWTWVLVQTPDSWVGVDTSRAPALVQEAIAGGLVPELAGFERCTPEVRYGVEGRSRIDLLLASGGTPAPPRSRAARPEYVGDERVYVEVKSTTLARGSGSARVGEFPDAVTTRGLKHLHELMHVVREGRRAALVFAIQRGDVTEFAPADAIDPAYGQALREAAAAGVELVALAASVDPESITLDRRVPLQLA
jgi:sugar fermentation stimulation protein A